MFLVSTILFSEVIDKRGHEAFSTLRVLEASNKHASRSVTARSSVLTTSPVAVLAIYEPWCHRTFVPYAADITIGQPKEDEVLLLQLRHIFRLVDKFYAVLSRVYQCRTHARKHPHGEGRDSGQGLQIQGRLHLCVG